MTRDVGLYFHIPFCVRKCAYCDFVSYPGMEDAMPAYADALIAEMGRRAAPEIRIATAYIGGGTPSLLPPELMDRLLDAAKRRFCFLPDAEWSCECNPGTVTEAFLAVLRAHGVNRLSLGAQARQERLLRLLGRIHTWKQVEQSVRLARAAGFENLNLDLMLGLPTQTVSDVRESLDAALALQPTHLSCYGLIVEEGTPLHARVRAGEWTLPADGEERDMYEACRSVLAENGFEQYEISNFARPGYACRHNTDCWKRREYLGLGCAACGFMGNIRYRNAPSLSGYLAGAPAEEETVFPEEARFESVMLGLRMTEGLREEDFVRMHGMTLRAAFGSKMDAPIRDGLLTYENGVLRLTRRGMDLQNRVLLEFL